jgi:hypothetical protein
VNDKKTYRRIQDDSCFLDQKTEFMEADMKKNINGCGSFEVWKFGSLGMWVKYKR